MKQSRNRFPVNLKLFGHDDPGEGDGAGAEIEEGTGAEAGAGEPAGGRSKKETPPSFDDVLKGGHQAEFDRRVQKAIGTAREKWEILLDDKLSEADKLAKMNKEEKAEYLRKKREGELSAREAEITKRELMAEAKNTLVEKNLPVELSEILNYTDADSCSKSIEVAEKAFQKAVEAGVQERLKGGKPPKKAPEGMSYTPEQVKMMSPGEINKNWDAISRSMETWEK